MGKQKSKWLDFGVGTDQIQANKLPVNYSPSNYTPVATGGEGLDKLSAHLKGIDTTIKNVIDTPGGYYDTSVLVDTPIGVGGAYYDTTHTVFTLPNGETYNSNTDELLVYVNGVLFEDGSDFNYEVSTSATTVTFLQQIPEHSRVRFRKLKRDVTIYDASILVTTDIGVAGTGYDAPHLVFTLPNGETYDGNRYDLEVYVDGLAYVAGVEFNYGAGGAATTVEFVSAIQKFSRVRFRKVTL